MAYTTRETPLQTPDGVSLHTKSWLPSNDTATTAQICFIHGFSDHGDRYAEYFPLLAERGIAVHALDQRGWGKSVSKVSERGASGPTSQVMDDISTFLKAFLPGGAAAAATATSAGSTMDIPTFLSGQSMGGQETLYWASTGPAEIRRQLAGFIAVGPWIQLHPKSQPSWLKLKAGRLASRLLPNHQLVNKLDASVLSHSAAFNESWIQDELCHDTGTLQGLDGALTRADELHYGTVALKDEDGLRVFVVHGGDDMVTSAEASKQWVEKTNVRDLTLKVYDGVYHNVHVDAPERLRDDTLEFVAKATTTSSGGQSQSKL